MLNSIRTFSFLFGYLPFAAMNLKKIKAKKATMNKAEYDRLVHQEPQKWAKGIMDRTQSDIKVSGLEHLPDGPALLVSNHEGNFDIPVLLSAIPKPFGFISKEEVKKFPVIPVYMQEMNCVFIDRSDRRSAYKSITDTVEKLKDGHSILIFPEGTRSKGEEIGEFKSGFMRIAREAGVPIVPIAIRGTADIMERNNNRVKAATVQVRVLEPLVHEEFSRSDAKAALSDVHSRIVNALNGMME